MALKCRNSKEDIKRQLVEEVARIESDLIDIMLWVGDKFVGEARKALNISGAFPKGDYEDRTHNLRGSINFYVLKDGQIIRTQNTGTDEGLRAADKAMESVEKKNGLQLIVVAGMDYASYVESKGFNVITSQADLAVINLEKLWKKYANKIDLLNNLNFNNL